MKEKYSESPNIIDKLKLNISIIPTSNIKVFFSQKNKNNKYRQRKYIFFCKSCKIWIEMCVLKKCTMEREVINTWKNGISMGNN
jgi:hypothetical protein